MDVDQPPVRMLSAINCGCYFRNVKRGAEKILEGAREEEGGAADGPHHRAETSFRS